MMNRNEKLEIARRLRLSTESELSRDDLEKMLEAELTKPEDEMDTGLVQQIVDLLEDAPTKAQQHQSWNSIEKKLSSRRWRPVVTGLTRIAAVGVILTALLLATYGTAQALNWEFLLRLMKPFSETFMVYTGNTPEPAPVTTEVYNDAELACTQADFTTLADCPDKIDGYPVKPVWMPERFAYLQGSMYSDVQVTSISHLFSSADGWCILDVTKFRNSEDATSYHFEQLPADNTTMYVANQQVAFYLNTDHAALTASWLSESASYFITGSISEEEVIAIIESMIE